MKYFIFLFFFSISSVMVSQNYTEKYNDLQQRYEYFGSNGQMVGYKQYNTVSLQWEYTDLTTSNNSQSDRYKTHDYGTPKSNFNSNLAIQALSNKQASYDRNKITIQNKINELYIKLEGYTDENKRNLALQMFENKVSSFSDKYSNSDLGNSSTTNRIINYFIDSYNEIIKYVNAQETKVSYKNKTIIIDSPFDLPLRRRPSINSETIYKIPSGSKIEVVDMSDDTFVKISVNGHIGYITKLWLK